MMWNWLVSGLARGATLILYDGSPFAREGRRLIDAIDEEQISVFGVGAKYLGALEKSGIWCPQRASTDLSETLLSTGSPLPHEGFEWVYRAFKPDLHLASISGGTDIVSCFVGGVPTLPVYAGQLQASGLGMATLSGMRRASRWSEEKGRVGLHASLSLMPGRILAATLMGASSNEPTSSAGLAFGRTAITARSPQRAALLFTAAQMRY